MTNSNRRRFPILLASALALLAILGALFLPDRAQAQAIVLVSNIGQETHSFYDANALVQERSQGFTTGGNTGGYNLDSVELKMTDYENVVVTVSLYSDSSGVPGSSIFTFTNPTSGITANANNTFTAPANTTLMASTPYHIVVSGANDPDETSNQFKIATAGTNAEDEGGATDSEGTPDWAIADKRYDWITLSDPPGWFGSDRELLIRVNGTAVGGTPSTDATLSVGDASATEGDTMTFPVTLSEAVTDDVTATWTASFGSKEEDAAAADLGSTTGTVTIEGGNTTGTFTVPTAGDSTDEHDETFTVTLSGVSSNAQLATAPTATGTITDDDDPPMLSMEDVSISESFGFVTFSVLLTPKSGKTVTVTLTASAESGDTAESPADFTAQSHMLTFNPGDLRVQTTVRTVNDAIVEPDETFTVTLSNATNAMISGATATGTITNDDTPTTCTLNPGDFWCGVVTVEAIEVTGIGLIAYGFSDPGSAGDLSDKEFSVGTNPYTIDGIAVSSGDFGAAELLTFSLTSALTAADRAKLVLHVGSASFAFSEVTPNTAHTYTWDGTGLDWSSEDYVTLRLRTVPTICTLNPGDLWCGVVTVGVHSLSGTLLGHGFLDVLQVPGVGALSDPGFSVVTTPYTIDSAFTGVGTSAGSLSFSLTSALTAADQAKLVLHVDGRSDPFAFSGVTPSATFHTYQWTGRGLDWSSEDYVTLRLREAAELPGLSVWDAAASAGSEMAFTVTLSDSIAEEVTATWTASIAFGNTAVAADLGSTTTGMVTFAPNATTARFVLLLGPIRRPGDSTFRVTLSGVSANARLVSNWIATGTIIGRPTSCTLNSGDIWCGRVTVGTKAQLNGKILGYGFHQTWHTDGVGGLPDRRFVYGGDSYRIDEVTVGAGGGDIPAGFLFFSMNRAFPVADEEKLALYVESIEFKLSEAHGPHNAPTYHWRDTGMNWSVASYVTLRLRDDITAAAHTEDSAAPLTAAFEGLPEAHDGKTAFAFRIAFSEAVTVTPAAMRTRVLTVTGGAVTGAARVDGESGVWAITVTPDTREELSIALAPTVACEADSAVCTADGRALSIGAAHLVNGPPDYARESNTEATGTPTISGTPQVGETLTADTSGIADDDGLKNVSFSYQWRADDTAIQGATKSTYTLADADEGKAISVHVSFTDDAGDGETLTSTATEAVAGNEEPVAREDVAAWSATMTVEWVYQGYGYYSTDTKKAGSLSPASFEVDGTTYTVKMVETQGWWMYIGVDRELPFDFVLELDGARFASGDASFASYSYGNIYRWEGTGLRWRDGDTVEVRLLRAVEDETAVNSPATGAPTISGTVQVGETLTADTSGIEDADGLDNAAFTYQWLADNAAIAGATGSTYTLADADEGKAIAVQVSFTDDAGNDETLTSAAAETVSFAVQPQVVNSAATGAPIISGTVQVGETLTADTSGIEDADGLDNAAFTYQWLADNAAMAGATGSTYTLADADEGKAIAVQVSFTDDAGNDETLTSAATETVSFAVQPQVANSPATGAPTISGTVQVGETLTADTSGIADENGLENLTFTYQWLADDDAIAGATDSTYTLADADEGKAIKVQVSFTDDAGNDETLTSAATDAVAAPEPPASPTGLSATASHDSVTLSWDDPGDDSITGYVILRRNRDIHAEGEFTNLVKDTGAAATTYTDDSVAAETPYTYRIKAINEHGESERSRWFHIDTPAAPDPADLALAEPPASPTGLAAEVSHDSVTLTWDDPGDDSITGYVILRRDSAIHEEGTFETVESDTGSAETAYTDDSAQPERKYVYRIKAINEHGLSEISSWVRAYTPAAPVPAAPTGLSASASHDSVTLTWDDPGDDSITGYVILRRNRDIDAKGEFTTLVEDTGATATTYTDDTVEPETPYTYRVKAINEHGESERSRWFHIDTPAAPLLAAPTGVGVAVSSDTVMLIWANPQDDSITGYRILRRDGDAQAGGEFTTIESDTGSAATTYADDTVEPERFYVYRVLAISPQGVSEPSRDVEVSTAAPVAPPEPLRSLRAHAGSTLLTNLGQDGKEGDALTAGADDLALGFTTGSNAGGYNLSGVRLDLAEVPVSPEDVSVELWSATGGATPAPQARIATLTHSTGTLVTGENTFYAPAGTTLQAGTIYFVFLSYGGSSATGFDLGITESTSADASSAPGWSLGQLFSRTRTPTGTWSASSGTLLVKFGILGGEPIEARLEPGDSASGTFDTQNTWYYFALDGLTPGRYTVSFSKGGIDAIYAPGNLITDQPREAATYTFDVRPDTTQTRYVSLRVWSDAGSYTASLDETMPDLVVGGPPVDGEIPKSSDRLGGPWGASMQLFPVELEAGVVYQVDIKGVDTDDGTMDYPMLANIAAPDGSYVGGTTHLFVQGGGEGRNVRYVFTADQDGMYFLKAGGALWKVYAVNGDSEGSRYRAGTFTVSIQETEEAPSCTLNRGDLWCGVVTVGSGSDVDGYDRGTGDDIGDLSDTDFDVGPNSYTIVGIFVDGFTADVPGTLSLVLHSNTRLSAADRDTLVLQVGGRSDSFALSDALVVAGRNVSWFSAGLDWSEEDYVIVRLREK